MSGRLALLYLDRGNGWECLTPHDKDQAALESLSIDWGTDSIDSQPDAPVLRFTIRDRTGSLAGDVLYLAGAKVWVQKTDAVAWQRFDIAGQWQQVAASVSWAELEDLKPSTIPSVPDTGLESVFYGRVTVGGEVTQRKRGDWLVSLYASGMSVLTQRQATQGPEQSGTLAGHHWPVDPVERLDVLQSRLTMLGVPFTADALEWLRRHLPPSLAPYGDDSHPDLITLVRNLASGSPDWPLVYETCERGRATPGSMTVGLPGAPAIIAMLPDGTIATAWQGHVTPTIPAELVMVDETTLGLPDPITQVTLKGKRVTWDGEKSVFGFEDSELTFSDRGLVPDNLTESQKSVSVDSDAVLKDDTGGHWTAGIYSPSDSDRLRRAAVILANSTRLRPQSLRVESRKVDDVEHADQFHAWPGLPLTFIHNRYTPLVARDGTPATAGAWLPVGGTLTYRHRAGEATWSNELDLHPLARDPTLAALRWRDLRPLTCKWERLPEMTWAEWGQIDIITTEQELEA
ncbi:hypothetical protein [Bifidobacterium cebidarum]|uniref:Uncharacterized protein n=1 Tax=Bifidobacterium cebidarum TaxID=2650773 RepID=A0A6I1GCU2_9BIFI|nr:hypothetical protein [Bifidobacterium cebidarum]KAB7789463.1 hypothetical protein F7D08_0415 [Bifidobacterium cebidarum]